MNGIGRSAGIWRRTGTPTPGPPGFALHPVNPVNPVQNATSSSLWTLGIARDAAQSGVNAGLIEGRNPRVITGRWRCANQP